MRPTGRDVHRRGARAKRTEKRKGRIFEHPRLLQKLSEQSRQGPSGQRTDRQLYAPDRRTSRTETPRGRVVPDRRRTVTAVHRNRRSRSSSEKKRIGNHAFSTNTNKT